MDAKRRGKKLCPWARPKMLTAWTKGVPMRTKTGDGLRMYFGCGVGRTN